MLRTVSGDERKLIWQDFKPRPPATAQRRSMAEALKMELEALGWHLTDEGLVRCETLCKQKDWKPTAKNVEKVALDLDLRSIGRQALSEDFARNQKHEVEGPLVLQVQRVRNVALPSTKQFSSGSGRRLLRVQLSDGRLSLSGVEMEGAIAGLSTQSPPGTKVLLLKKVEAQKGFLLLGKHSLKVLGGHVEHLVQKWNLTKITADGLGTSRSAGGSCDAPQFITFGSGKSSGIKSGLGKRQNMKQLENRKGSSAVSTREAAVSSMTKEDEREKMELPQTEENTVRKALQHRKINDQEKSGRGQETSRQTRNTEEREGARNYRGNAGEGGDVRGRGRGRRGGRRGGERDEYHYDQGKKTESSMLSDWLEQKLIVSSNFESQQQPQVTGGRGEEEYWEEVWAYQESLAMAESKEQWRREEKEREGREREGREGEGREREREGRAGVSHRGGWEDGRGRRGGGGRGEQGGRGREADYRLGRGRGSEKRYYDDSWGGNEGVGSGQRSYQFERGGRGNESRWRPGRGGWGRGKGGWGEDRHFEQSYDRGRRGREDRHFEQSYERGWREDRHFEQSYDRGRRGREDRRFEQSYERGWRGREDRRIEQSYDREDRHGEQSYDRGRRGREDRHFEQSYDRGRREREDRHFEQSYDREDRHGEQSYDRGRREREEIDFGASRQKHSQNELGNKKQDERRSGEGERGQRRKDGGGKSEIQQQQRADSETSKQKGSSEDREGAREETKVLSSSSSSSAVDQQYNWGWVQKGAPSGAKKVGL